MDIKLGKVKVVDIINVHDSGRLINPKLAQMQVHGGMLMGIGYGLSEQMLIDPKTGRVLNGTLLDYKLPTMMDAPDLEAEFVELDDPTAPFGNKAWVSHRQFRLHRQSVMPCFMQRGWPLMRFRFHLSAVWRHLPQPDDLTQWRGAYL